MVGPESSSTRVVAVGWLDAGETAVVGVLDGIIDDRHDGARRTVSLLPLFSYNSLLVLGSREDQRLFAKSYLRANRCL